MFDYPSICREIGINFGAKSAEVYKQHSGATNGLRNITVTLVRCTMGLSTPNESNQYRWCFRWGGKTPYRLPNEHVKYCRRLDTRALAGDSPCQLCWMFVFGQKSLSSCGIMCRPVSIVIHNAAPLCGSKWSTMDSYCTTPSKMLQTLTHMHGHSNSIISQTSRTWYRMKRRRKLS